MKAVVVQKPNSIDVREVPDPICGEYDALCNVVAASICNGTDNHIVGNDPYHKITYPTILGHEGIGRVVSFGTKVRNFTAGDLVTRVVNKLPKASGYALHWGAFAERAIVTDWQAMRDDGIPEKTWSPYTIHRTLPLSFDPIASTMIITWRETYSFLKRMNPVTGEILLIIGSGANALAFTDHARNLELRTIVIGSIAREKEFRNAGATLFIPYKIDDYISTLKESELKHADIIIDAIGDDATLNKALPFLKSTGKLGVYGLNNFINYHIDHTRLNGDYSYFDPRIYDEGSAHDAIVSYIQKDKLNAWHYLSKDHIYPLKRIRDALKASREHKVIKSVITFI